MPSPLERHPLFYAMCTAMIATYETVPFASESFARNDVRI